jgi:TonB dependent receptor/Carboxypeptidase regulatory-like domain/TonB-dependent Receptor Plug Domain
MRKCVVSLLVVGLLAGVLAARATIFGSIRGIIHDPQHRPIAGADVKLQSGTSDFSLATQTNQDGEFTFNPVPAGDYIVTVTHAGFADAKQNVTLISESSPILHIPLAIAAVNQTTTVFANAEVANVDSATPTTLLDRQAIARTPGADRSNSLQMITDYVPGSYVTHDQLHVRGGHQVSWLIDGVPIPNTNIASNVGPQIDPKDIDYLEAQRGSYDAAYGDRTYGVFDVVPRTGFERNNDAELVSTFGNWYQSNDQISFGGHTERFAYFTSLNGNRSNYGLQTPIGQVFHDAENGYGGFASLIFNANPDNQLRFVTSLRRDYYQIPYDPDPSANPASNGLRDAQQESDAVVDFSWVHTFNPNIVLTVSPFYHYNSANYAGSPNDFPISTADERGSKYGGAQTTLNVHFTKNDAQAGFYGFSQHDTQTFGLLFNDGSGTNFQQRESPLGSLASLFVDDKFKIASWLTLIAGMRYTHFSGTFAEDATDPRFGVALEVPHLHWVFHAFYGKYYQAPPLLTASGPLLDFVTSQSLGFIPLHGERDEESQTGVTIPFRGWAVDLDAFQTRAKNFFDHNNVGNSDIFFPLTIDGARIRGTEVAVRSPRIWGRGQFHLAYSNQVAEGRGAITGGLTDFSAPAAGYFFLDHDQRNTLNLGFNANLPWQIFASTNVYYGSGFSNGSPGDPFPGDHLPQHTTFDLSVGKSFGEKYSVSITSLNVANRRLLIDNSVTFGGFHYDDPREIYVEVRYKFHY